MRLVERTRRTRVLRRVALHCFRDGLTVNLTAGCLHDCVYCYAQGFESTPKDGSVHLYENIPNLLLMELNRMRRRPTFVSFSTASDPFQPQNRVLSTAFSTFEILLRRGTCVSFLTKGVIPQEFMDLFSRYRHLVRARIGIASTKEEYRRTFEPAAASLAERLMNIEQLVAHGIDTEARIDPLIPGVTDTLDDLETLLRALSKRGIRKVTVSYLILRPYLYRRLFERLGKDVAVRIVAAYKDEPWQTVITSSKTRLFPQVERERRYSDLKRLGRSLGIDVRMCGCKNPDLPFECCEPVIRNCLFGASNAP